MPADARVNSSRCTPVPDDASYARPAVAERPPRPLTVRRLCAISLPLALTFLMMSGSAPIVTAGIAWMQEAAGERVHISAFLLTFATALLVYSPAFAARNVAIRMVVDRRSMIRFIVGNAVWGVVSASLLVAISKSDTVGNFVFMHIYHVEPDMAALAREGVIWFVPMPFLIVLRGLGQGCHITNDDGWYVGIGTALRLVGMALYVFAFAIRTDVSGPALGGQAFVVAIGIETVYVLAMLRGRPQWYVRESRSILSYGQFVRYAGPLMLAATLGQLAPLMLIRLINRANLPQESLGGYDLVRSSIWLMLSALNCVQPIVIAHGTSRRNLGAIVRFTAALLVLPTILVAVLAFTPLHHVVYERWMRVDNLVMVGLVYAALYWVLPLPLLLVSGQAAAGLHIRSGRTGWVTAGTIGGLLLLASMPHWVDTHAWDGTVLAVFAFLLFHIVGTSVQFIGLLRDGVGRALSSRDLSEQMTAKPTGD